MSNGTRPGEWAALAIWTTVVFAIGWGLGRDFGEGKMQPEPHDGTQANYISRHLFSTNEYTKLRLMRLPQYDLVREPVWAAQGKDGKWYPFFREDY